MTTAAEDIYISYHDKVSAYIRGKLDNHHDTEDLVSQVFEKVYGKIQTFDESNLASLWLLVSRRSCG